MTVQEFITLCKNTAEGDYAQYSDETIKSLVLAQDISNITNMHIFKLRHCLLVKEYMDVDKDAALAAKVLNHINSVVGGGANHFFPFEADNWTKAISLIKSGFSHGDNRFSQVLMPSEEKALRFTKALKRFRSLGMTYQFEEFDISFGGTEKKALSHIDNMVKLIGGVVFLDEMFAFLQYSNELQRFWMPLQGNVIHPLKKEVEYPFNFMMNLGLKHIRHDGKKTNDTKSTTAEIISMCQDLCFVLYTAQTWDIWDDIFHIAKSNMEYLRDLIYKKSIYRLNQASPAFAMELCQYIVDYHNSHPGVFIITQDYTLDDFMEMMNICMKMAQDTQIVRKFLPQKYLRMTKRTKESLLSKICLKESRVNENFLYPEDYLKVNYWPYPMFVDSKGLITMMPKPVMSWCWVEALMAIVRSENKSFESEMGTIIECYLKEKMTKQGIHHVCGEYKKPKTGECDHVVVATDRLIFIEDKKKALTRSAHAGNTDDIVIDLAKSLVLSQEQCHGHAVDLLENKKLEMTEKTTGHSYTLDDKIREFDYVSLSLSDYGPVQARVLLQQVLNLFCKSKFGVDMSAYKNASEAEKKRKTIKQVNEYLDDLRNHIVFLSSIKQKGAYKPFFDSWFLSLEQMTFLVSQSHSGDDLVENMKKIKFCTYGTYDFYEEWLRSTQRQ